MKLLYTLMLLLLTIYSAVWVVLAVEGILNETANTKTILNGLLHSFNLGMFLVLSIQRLGKHYE